MELRIQLLAIAASGLLLLVVLELVRRKAFLERYALLWLLSALVLLGLSIWQGFLEELASTIGVAYPPNALFLVAFGFVLVLLLHFSLAVSRLSDQSKVLAQRLALLEQRQRETEERLPESDEGAIEELEIAGRTGRITGRRRGTR
ncbi:MAG: DUF2304 domain-containing protein [Thermoleophilaceae bacterium]